MRPTLDLLGELAGQTRALVLTELLRERASVSSSLTKLGVGLIFLPIGAHPNFRALRTPTTPRLLKRPHQG